LPRDPPPDPQRGNFDHVTIDLEHKEVPMNSFLSTRRGFLLATGAGAFMGADTSHAQQGHDQHRPLSTAEKERQAFPFLAMRMFVEVDSDDTKGAVSVVRVFVPPDNGPPPHVHSREEEVHTVLRGHYRYRHGDEEVDAPPGTTIFMPRGVPHVFKNISNEPGEHLLTLIPGGMEKMFREVSAAKLQLPRDLGKLAQISGKYGLTNLPPAALPLSTGAK
jgi:quercetin dioxygenase-like cupin family protein